MSKDEPPKRGAVDIPGIIGSRESFWPGDNVVDFAPSPDAKLEAWCDACNALHGAVQELLKISTPRGVGDAIAVQAARLIIEHDVDLESFLDRVHQVVADDAGASE